MFKENFDCSNCHYQHRYSYDSDYFLHIIKYIFRCIGLVYFNNINIKKITIVIYNNTLIKNIN